MARVNVFMKDELLRAVDDEARASGLNRSGLIQQALSAWLMARQAEREQAAIRKEMEASSQGMDALAERLGAWDPTRAIRGFRDRRVVEVSESKRPYATRGRGRRK